MTIDPQTLLLVGLVAFFFYQHKVATNNRAIAQQLGFERGKNYVHEGRQVLNLHGFKKSGFWIFERYDAKHLLIERENGMLKRIDGDTMDLNVFPELTEQQRTDIKNFLSAGANIAAKVAASGTTPMIH
jgi:hypothetical protein